MSMCQLYEGPCLYLPPYADATNPNNYHPATVWSISPTHYRITYTDTEGIRQHIRVLHKSLLTYREAQVQCTKEPLYAKYLVPPREYCPQEPLADNDLDPKTTDPEREHDHHIRLEIMRSLDRANDLLHELTYNDVVHWVSYLLEALDVETRQRHQEQPAFLRRIRDVIGARLDSGCW